MKINKAIALRVSELLEEKNMTQYNLSKKASIPYSTLSGILKELNETCSFSVLYAIADGFDMSIQEFLTPELFNDKIEYD